MAARQSSNEVLTISPRSHDEEVVSIVPFPTDEIKHRRTRLKSTRFSLHALHIPVLRMAAKDTTKNGERMNDKGSISEEGLSNGKTGGSKKNGHVTFSPSTEEKEENRLKRSERRNDALKRLRRLSLRRSSDAANETLQRSQSIDGSIGRAEARKLQHPAVQGRRRVRSMSFSKKGIQIDETSYGTSKGKGRIVNAKVSRRKALAARHARVLERIINAGTSLELEELKAKRLQKVGPRTNDRTKVQLYPVVSPRKIKALKAALTDQNSAIEIISELRFMQINKTTLAAVSVAAPTNADPEASKAEAALPGIVEGEQQNCQFVAPIKAVCLDCTDEEAARRSEAIAATTATTKANPDQQPSTVQSALNIATSPGLIGAALNKISIWWQPSSETRNGARGGAITDAIEYAYEVEEDIRQGDIAEALADTTRLGSAAITVTQPTIGAIATQIETLVLPENKVPGVNNTKVVTVTSINEHNKAIEALSSISPISLITAPRTTLATIGAQQSGAIDVLATLSGAAIATARGGEQAMLLVRPPTDRMSIFVYWWGFEITLPEPSMSYLGTAHSVSGAFMGFLQTMVTTGGVPELLPFIRYISSFMEMEFSAIKSQDRNKRGVVIAATWLMPLALVPRPWDYGGYEDKRPITQPTPTFKHASSTRQRESTPLAPPGGLPILLPVRKSSISSS